VRVLSDVRQWPELGRAHRWLLDVRPAGHKAHAVAAW
jgi:hypothetical protein